MPARWARLAERAGGEGTELQDCKVRTPLQVRRRAQAPVLSRTMVQRSPTFCRSSVLRLVTFRLSALYACLNLAVALLPLTWTARSDRLHADLRLADDAVAALLFPGLAGLLAGRIEVLAVGGQVGRHVLGGPGRRPGLHGRFDLRVAAAGAVGGVAGAAATGAALGAAAAGGRLGERCGGRRRCRRLRRNGRRGSGCRHGGFRDRGGRGSGHGCCGRGSGRRRRSPATRARREQLADQRQLGLHRGVAGIELQGAAVGLAGQLGVDVAEVLVRGGVAGVGADRHLERGTRLVELALAGVQHREVVVRLGQLGVVLGELGEGGDGVGRAALLR